MERVTINIRQRRCQNGHTSTIPPPFNFHLQQTEASQKASSTTNLRFFFHGRQGVWMRVHPQ